MVVATDKALFAQRLHRITGIHGRQVTDLFAVTNQHEPHLWMCQRGQREGAEE